LHRIACGVGSHDLQERGVQAGKQAQTGFPSAPFFRDRPGDKTDGCWSS
jgi:hypothetical protein